MWTFWSDADDRLLVDAGVLVRPLELGHRVDVGAHFARHRLRSPLRRGRRCAGCRRSRPCPSGAPRRTAPESRAVMYSMPVPTYGARARSSGTAWRCMFDPISARLASSFSRNGTSEAATETSCFGDTSMKSTLSRVGRMKLPAWRALTRSVVNRPFSSTCGVGLRDDVLVLFPRRQVEGVAARTRGRGGGGRRRPDRSACPCRRRRPTPRRCRRPCTWRCRRRW